MENIQNVYDNDDFYNEYKSMRDSKINANELIEIPIIKSMLPDIKDKTILDLGCGAGGMSQYFAEHGAKYVLGVDISTNMLSEAKQNNKFANVEYKKLAMEDLSKLNQKFDLVFSSLAFHYVEDFDKLMRDISSLLNNNGILLFSQEHPLATATILGKDLAKYIEKDGKRYFLLSDYNNLGQRRLIWNIEGVIKYHRNFSTIINTITNAGLNIIEVKESTASDEAIKLVDKYKYQKDKPFFVFFKSAKNN